LDDCHKSNIGSKKETEGESRGARSKEEASRKEGKSRRAISEILDTIGFKAPVSRPELN